MVNVNRQLETSHEIHDDCVLVTAHGQVDVLTTPDLATELTVARGAAEPSVPVVVDLRGIEFLGVQGVARLLDTHYECLRVGTPFRIVADHRAVLRPLRALGFDGTFDIATRMESVGAGFGAQRESSASSG